MKSIHRRVSEQHYGTVWRAIVPAAVLLVFGLFPLSADTPNRYETAMWNLALEAHDEGSYDFALVNLIELIPYTPYVQDKMQVDADSLEYLGLFLDTEYRLGNIGGAILFVQHLLQSDLSDRQLASSVRFFAEHQWDPAWIATLRSLPDDTRLSEIARFVAPDNPVARLVDARWNLMYEPYAKLQGVGELAILRATAVAAEAEGLSQARYDALLDLGAGYLAHGRTNEAAVAFATAVDETKGTRIDSSIARFVTAGMAMHQGEYNEAAGGFEQLLADGRIDDPFFLALTGYNLAGALDQKGDAQGAYAAFFRAMDMALEAGNDTLSLLLASDGAEMLGAYDIHDLFGAFAFQDSGDVMSVTFGTGRSYEFTTTLDLAAHPNLHRELAAWHDYVEPLAYFDFDSETGLELYEMLGTAGDALWDEEPEEFAGAFGDVLAIVEENHIEALLFDEYEFGFLETLEELSYLGRPSLTAELASYLMRKYEELPILAEVWIDEDFRETMDPLVDTSLILASDMAALSEHKEYVLDGPVGFISGLHPAVLNLISSSYLNYYPQEYNGLMKFIILTCVAAKDLSLYRFNANDLGGSLTAIDTALELLVAGRSMDPSWYESEYLLSPQFHDQRSVIHITQGDLRGALQSVMASFRASSGSAHFFIHNRLGTYNNLGALYSSWGELEKALAIYLNAGQLRTVRDDELQWFVEGSFRNQESNIERYSTMADFFVSLSGVLLTMGRYDEAQKYLGHLVDRLQLDASRLGDQFDMAIAQKLAMAMGQQAVCLTQQGHAHEALEVLENALLLYNQAYGRMTEFIGTAMDTASLETTPLMLLVQKASVLRAAGEPGDALGILVTAQTVAEELGNRSFIVYVSFLKAKCLEELERFEEAEETYGHTLALLDEYRSQAAGPQRRSFLSTTSLYAKALVSLYLKMDRFDDALAVYDRYQSVYLREYLGYGADHESFDPSHPERLLTLIPADTAYLVISDANEENMGLLLVTRDGVRGVLRRKTDLIDRFSADRNGEPLHHGLTDTRFRDVFDRTRTPTIDRGAEIAGEFAEIVLYYRDLISGLYQDEGELSRIGTILGGFVLGGFEDSLAGLNRVVVIPDGPLSGIPFETLRLGDGSYLIEELAVGYAYSLSSHLNTTGLRATPPGNDMTIIAFGGATYREPGDTQQRGLVVTGVDGFQAETQTATTPESEAVLRRDFYASLGYTWSELPGTLAEVEAIGALNTNARILTGSDVSESRVKELSRSGELAEHQIIHFATHGYMVPEYPELATLVLSQIDDGREDGYLTMPEVAALDLDARLVNLSACETGLGTYFIGEGIVGLTQAFLTAGADEVSVSLWSIGDASTRLFMTRFYELVLLDGLDSQEAMRETKREFIAGEAYSHPYYWSAFALYGR